MKMKDKTQYYRVRSNRENRLILSKSSEVRLVLIPNRKNQIKYLDIQFLKIIARNLEVVSQVKIPYRNLELFFKKIDSLKDQMEEEFISPGEPEVKRLRYK